MSPGVYIQERDRGRRRIRPITPIFIGDEQGGGGGGGGGGDIPETFFIYGMGDNYYFQLAQPNYDILYTPVQIPNISGVTKVVAQIGDDVCALRNDGYLWIWGASYITPEKMWDIEWSDVVASPFGNAFLGIKPDGTLWAWGANNSAQLGLGDTVNRETPTQVGTETDWVQLAMNNLAVVGIRASGSNTLWGWGVNSEGELALGTPPSYTPITTPIQIGDISGWEKIVLANGVLFAIKEDGTLWSAGSSIGLLGQYDYEDEEFTGYSYSLNQVGSDTDWQDVSAYQRDGVALGLKTNGELYSWGNNNGGAQGLGTYCETPVPTRVGTDTWESLGVNAGFTSHAMKNGGQLWGWGDGWLVGNNSSGDILSPLPVGRVFSKVYKLNELNMYGIASDGTLYGWGRNYASFGIIDRSPMGINLAGTVKFSTAPIKVTPDNIWVSASNNDSLLNAFGIKSDGSLWSWGDNKYGQLGYGNKEFGKTPQPVLLTGSLSESRWKTVSAGKYSTVAITTDGKLATWGTNTSVGLLGIGSRGTECLGTTFRDKSDINFYYPIWIEQGSTWKEASLSDTHALAIQSNGTLWAWGENSYGELGIGTYEVEPSPVQVGMESDWKYVSIATGMSVGIKESGSLWGWGYNKGYCLALPTDSDYGTPRCISSGPWKQVVVHSWNGNGFGIKQDGTLWGWGDNRQGFIPTPEGTLVDEGLTGLFNSSSALGCNIGEFISFPSSSTRIVTTGADATVESIENILIGQASLLESMTPTVQDPEYGGNDEGYWILSLPFNVEYNGTSYDSIYVNSNSYVSFGGSYIGYDMTEETPLNDKIYISAYDNYVYRIYYGQEGDTFRIRWEGNTQYDESGVAKVWEMVFYQNAPNQIDIHVGDNGNWTPPGDYIKRPVLMDSGSWERVTPFGVVKSDGTLWTWGRNDRGQMGVGDTNNRTELTQVGSATDWRDISDATTLQPNWGYSTKIGLKSS